MPAQRRLPKPKTRNQRLARDMMIMRKAFFLAPNVSDMLKRVDSQYKEGILKRQLWLQDT
jgi:hypothetical protein